MKKQNSMTSNVGDFAGRITRAQAAALSSAGQMPPLKDHVEENKRMARQGNTKRAALDENNTDAPDNPHHQHKRRAVLRDVTNVCCKSSCKSCFNDTKIQVNAFSSLFVHNSDLCTLIHCNYCIYITNSLFNLLIWLIYVKKTYLLIDISIA